MKEKRQEDKENKEEYSVMKGSDEKGARKEIVEKSTRNEAVIEVKAVEENIVEKKTILRRLSRSRRWTIWVEGRAKSLRFMRL